MHQISKVELAEIILLKDQIFNEYFFSVKEDDSDDLDVLFSYGDHVTKILKNAYKLKNYSKGVHDLAEVVSHLVEYYDTDEFGIIDIYVFEPIVDAGKSEFLWFLKVVDASGQKLLKEFFEADVSVAH